MPFVNIRIVKEVIEADPVGIKKRIGSDVAQAIAAHAGIEVEKVWVVIDEVPETEWFVGGRRVKELRAEG